MRKLLILAVLGYSGCHTFSSGFDRGALYATLGKEGPLQVTDEEVQKALELRPQLVFPCKIAIYLYEPDHSNTWRWSAKDKETILRWMDGLKRDGLVAEAFIMAGMFAKGSNMKELRLSAAQHGADAVLVLKAAHQLDSYVNPAAFLNATVVGGYVVPASHRDALFVIQGGLVDVSNGFLYATMEAEGEGSIVRPTFTIQERDAVEPAKKKALDNLGPELVRRLRNLRSNGGRPTIRLEQPVGYDGPVTPSAIAAPSAIPMGPATGR